MKIPTTQDVLRKLVCGADVYNIMKFIQPTCIGCQKIIEKPGYIVNMELKKYSVIRSVYIFIQKIENNSDTYIKLEYGKCNSTEDTEGNMHRCDPYDVLRGITKNYDNVCLETVPMKPEFLEYIYDKFRNNIACSEECCKNSKDKTSNIDIHKIMEESDEWIININGEYGTRIYEGKYKSKTFREVYQKDPKYILEMYNNMDILYGHYSDDYKTVVLHLNEVVGRKFGRIQKIGLTGLLQCKYNNKYVPFGKREFLTLRKLYHYEKKYLYWMLDNMGLEKLNSYPIMKEFINDIKKYDITELGDYIRDKVRNSGTQFI